MPRLNWLSQTAGNRFARGVAILVALLTTLLVVGVPAPAAEISIQLNSWGRFAPGSWHASRIVTETLDADGNVVAVNTTEQETTLVKVTSKNVTLRIESSVEVGGKKFAAPVQTILQGSLGETEGEQPLRAEDLGTDRTSVAGQPIECRVRRYVIADNELERSVKVFYAPDVAPYILRRETIATGRRGQKVRSRTDVQVVALERPHRVLTEVLPTAHLKTVYSDSKGATVTYAIHAPEVPGEVVSYSSQEKDLQGRVVRRSTMELVDYGYGSTTVSDSEDSPNIRRGTRRSRRRERR